MQNQPFIYIHLHNVRQMSSRRAQGLLEHQRHQRGAVRWRFAGQGLPDSLASGVSIATWPRQASQSFGSGPEPDAWHA